jgi:hypothetical protein
MTMYKRTMKLTMCKFAFAALLASLNGCASHDPASSSYGNFVPDSPAASDQKMAFDAVQRLIAVFPPARTRFDLQQVTSDAFGTALVAALRSNGYALLEYPPSSAVPGASDLAAPTGQATASAVNTKSSSTALALHYVLDFDKAAQLYRVALLVGNQSLTRAYLAQNGSVAAAGAWVRKE